MIPLADLVAIVAIAAGAALAVALIGAAALAAVRRRPIAAGLAVLVLTVVGAGAAATSATGVAMFLSAHDLRVLFVVVVVAAAVGAAGAALLARRLVAGVRDVAGVARSLADGEPVALPAGPLPAELAALANDLVTAADRLAAARAGADPGEQPPRARRLGQPRPAHSPRGPARDGGGARGRSGRSAS